MSGEAAVETVNSCSSQWADTTKRAFGFSGRLDGMLFSHSAVLSHVSTGPPISVQSMKKHGPPPCGMNRVGIFVEEAVIFYSRC